MVFNREMSFRPLRNEKGQIAIFLVLVFQILFVFFAMSVNMGLVVYDKINLQNATDIAAYYAAEKQAEMLNQIGHINYQIRQAYKLLAFRLRVVGSASIGVGAFAQLPKHPIFQDPGATGEGDEGTEFFPKLGTSRHAPGVCIGSTLWQEYAITEGSDTVSLCQNLDGFSAVPAIPGGDVLGLSQGLNGFLNAVAAELQQKCKVVGVINWQLATAWLLGFMNEGTKRTDMINGIAKQMSLPGQSMTDFTGGSVYSGTLNTLKKNLTDPQQAGVAMTLINSLSSDVSGPCSNPDFWLPNIKIFPVVSYVRMVWNDLRCTTKVVTSRSAANLPPSDYIAMVGGAGNPQLVNAFSSNGPVPMGVEKNPWCAPYMMVKAQTQPRKIFSPLGGPTVMTAEAIAKPFGGRIGPWYSTTWPAGSPTSQGTTKTDPLLPARQLPSGGTTPDDPAADLVNYSKYPGDVNGLNSRYALGAMGQYFINNVTHHADTNHLPSVLSLQHYTHIGDPQLFESQPDSLALQNTSPIDVTPVRLMEEAAITPDLFDITYYSIEAQYSYNFFNPTLSQFRSGITDYWLDLGSSNRAPYSIVNQIQKSNQLYSANPPFYMVSDPNQMLTGWTQNRAVDYSFPDTFGKCLQRRDGEMPQAPGPSGCPHGGRSGYSVKIVSKKYLKNVNAELGGKGISGAISNPPE